MSYITIGMIALTAIALIFGTLWGMGRGRNRSILRLILIIVCVLGAIFLRPVITNAIMNLDTGDGTIAEMLSSSFSQGGDEMPAAMQNLVVALIEIIFGLVSYFVVFFALRIVTWILIYPICKIFVKREIIKKKGWGALIGLIQGLVIAFAVVVPLNGLTTTMGKLSKIEMEGKPMIEMPAEMGLEDHVSSATNGIYNAIGGWYYNILTSTETEDSKITLNAAADVFGAMMGTVTGIEEMGNGVGALTDNSKTLAEKVDILRDSSDKLEKAGKILDDLDTDAEKLFNEIIASLKDMMGSGEGSDEMAEIFDGLTADKLGLTSIASCFDGIATYVEKAEMNVGGDVTQEDVEKIVNNFVGSDFLVDMIIGDGTNEVGTLYQVQAVDQAKFMTAIQNNQDLTALQKYSMMKVLGLAD